MSENHETPVRDAWLSQALRHAPDAEVSVPAAVSETILRQARSATVPSGAARAAPSALPAPTWAERLGAVWAALARPPVAAGFASLMVATVVGLMWWDRPLEETLPPRQAPAAAAPAPQQAGEPATAVTAAPKPAQAQVAPSRIVVAPAPERKTAAPAATAPPAPAAPRAVPAPPVMPTAPTLVVPALQRDMAMAKSAPSVVATPAISGAAAGAAPPARESTERRDEAAALSAPPLPSAAAPTAVAATASASSAIATPGLRNLRFEIAAGPQAWTWQRDDSAAQPIDSAVQAWIVQADRSAFPHWKVGAVGNEAVSATLRFTRGGVVRAVLRIGPTGLRLTRSGTTESAELSSGAAAALLSALEPLGQ